MGYLIYPKEVYLENNVSADVCIRTEGKNIAGIASKHTPEPGPEDQTVELEGLSLLPGFIDIHIHGGNGYDVMDGTYESINGISLYKLREGVTTFCPSTVTAELDKTEAVVRIIREAMDKGVDGAKIAGIFLEGPMINKKYKGAHVESLIREVSLEEINRLIAAGAGAVISYAIAPEMENAPEAIRLLRRQGIHVRLGHTAATYEQACIGIEAGGSIAIHTYNAMSSLNHREPGMVGAVLERDDIYNEIICDFVHVHPAAVRLLYKAKTADRLILITDCMMAGGLQDGRYELGDNAVTVQDGIVRTADGALAGSTLTIAKAFANMHEVLGIDYAELVKMTSATPARALGLYEQTGSVTVGKRADLVGIDAERNVRFVMVDGIIKMMNGEML